MKSVPIHPKKILTLAVFLLCSATLPHNVLAQSLNEPCAKIEIVFARGSGDGPANDAETSRFVEQTVSRLHEVSTNISSHAYALGSEMYGGAQYRHVAVGVGNIDNAMTTLDAITGGDKANKYSNSVNSGISELSAYLNQRYRKCKDYDTYYVLGGYSQGAQVIGQSLSSISLEIRNRILFVGLFGDPKLYLPEGKTVGIWPFQNTPACNGEHLSLYRRYIARCDLMSGSLGARNPYIPVDMLSKTGTWCVANDFICRSSRNIFSNDGHEKYKLIGGPIDSAAREAATRIQNAIIYDPPTDSSTSNPTHSPNPTAPQFIDTLFHFGDSVSGHDVVFLVDTASDTTRNLMPDIKQYIRDKGKDILAEGGRFAVAGFSDVYVRGDDGSEYRTAVPHTIFDYGPMLLGDGSGLIDALLNVDYGHSYLGSPLAAVQSTLDTLAWKPGAVKSIILITGQTDIGTSDNYGNTVIKNALRALEIDPVNVYPLVPQNTDHSTYDQLAEQTSGKVTTYGDDNFRQAADSVIDTIKQRPVALFKLGEYIADPGQEIKFDASNSYVIDSTITKYDWDFDGDNHFETTTTTPVIQHTYTQNFDGLAQVRVTAANGLMANATTKIKVGTYIPPVLPKAPTGLKATVLGTTDAISTVKLTWHLAPEDRISAQALSINGIILGLMEPDQTTITITDVDRSFDNEFSVASVSDNNEIGDSAFTTINALTPQTPPSTDTSTTASRVHISAATTNQANNDPNPTLNEAPLVLGSRSKKLPLSQGQETPDSFAATSADKVKTAVSTSIPWYIWATLAVLFVSSLGFVIKRFHRA